MKKITKKTVKKEFKPAYIVDLTDAVTYEDTILAFANAKMRAALTDNEVDAIVMAVMKETLDGMTSLANTVVDVNKTMIDISNGASVVINKDGVKIKEPKKPNIFKRFWNWLTRKK